ncbi:MAG: SGNH/GDSL hydrolase family protein [Vicinamibacterales bacterium]
MRRYLFAFALLGLIGCNQIKSITSPTTPTPTPAPSNAAYYTAVGASDGIGFGGSAVCVPLSECPNGTGYVQILHRRLTASGKTVTHLNLSIPAAVLSRTIEDLSNSIGRSVPGNFIERESPFVQTLATHVTVFAGGNDVNVISLAAKAKGGSDPNGFADAQIRQWGVDLDDLIARIRTRSANTRIVALNLPNLAASPYINANTLEEKRVVQRVAVGLTDKINALTAKGVLVVDLMCEPRLLLPSNYAADGFHPNDSGYAIIADLATNAFLNGTASTPNPSCAQRTIY